jgi:hypothetical protein
MTCEGSRTRGTGSSNPSPSSGESRANLTSPDQDGGRSASQEGKGDIEFSVPIWSDMIGLDVGSGQWADSQLSNNLPWEGGPHRLWSLWDMIRIALLKYIQLGAQVQNADKIFENLTKL